MPTTVDAADTAASTTTTEQSPLLYKNVLTFGTKEWNQVATSNCYDQPFWADRLVVLTNWLMLNRASDAAFQYISVCLGKAKPAATYEHMEIISRLLKEEINSAIDLLAVRTMTRVPEREAEELPYTKKDVDQLHQAPSPVHSAASASQVSSSIASAVASPPPATVDNEPHDMSAIESKPSLLSPLDIEDDMWTSLVEETNLFATIWTTHFEHLAKWITDNNASEVAFQHITIRLTKAGASVPHVELVHDYLKKDVLQQASDMVSGVDTSFVRDGQDELRRLKRVLANNDTMLDYNIESHLGNPLALFG